MLRANLEEAAKVFARPMLPNWVWVGERRGRYRRFEMERMIERAEGYAYIRQ